MTKDAIEAVLKRCLSPEKAAFMPPNESDWRALELKFACEFPIELRCFIELMASYSFPGEILNVGAGPNNGNDTINIAYDLEDMENPDWLKRMVPFYAIGNGDYFCVASDEGQASSIYYYYAEQRQFKKYCDSMETWVKQLPEFLSI
jgi:hypothetical protein